MHLIKKEKILEKLYMAGVSKSIVERVLIKKKGFSKEQFFLQNMVKISKEEIEEIIIELKKVAFWYPIEYVINEAEFYGRKFYVDKGCLIPRDDTELMVEKALLRLEDYKNAIYIDVWTWSGAIPISMCLENGMKNISKSYAIEISKQALLVAHKNVIFYNLERTIELIQGDLLWDIVIDNNSDNDVYIITANLPYIKDLDHENMDIWVVLHEPSVALYWWKVTGFELYEKLIYSLFKQSKTLEKSICLFIEIWFDQSEVAAAFLENANLKFSLYKDVQWVDRCIEVYIKEC